MALTNEEELVLSSKVVSLLNPGRLTRGFENIEHKLLVSIDGKSSSVNFLVVIRVRVTLGCIVRPMTNLFRWRMMLPVGCALSKLLELGMPR